MLLVEKIKSKGKILESDQSKLPSGVLCRGVWPICNIGMLNQNNRVYEKEVWDKVLADKAITEKMDQRTLFGQAEHPEKTQSDLQLTSHIITNTFFDNVNESGKTIEKAFQEIDVLDTPCGRIINTLIMAGCQVGMSTRAEGDLEEKEGEDGKKYQNVMSESYNYVTTDFTADPSTFNVSPVSVESSLVKEVVVAAHEKDIKNRVSKDFAVSILEGCKSKEGVAALNDLLEEEECKCCSRSICVHCDHCSEKKTIKTVEDLINYEMVKLGAGIVIKEGKFGVHDIEVEVKGKVTEIKEGQITIELEDGTTIAGDTATISTDSVEITLPSGQDDMPVDDILTDELEPGVEDEVDLEEPEAVDELEDEEEEYDMEGELNQGDPRDPRRRPGYESIQLIPENYDHMVAWMQRKLKNAPLKDRQMFGNLVRTKLLNEKITPSSTSKEIRRLKIKEASIRAERDESLEVLEEIEAKLKDVTARSPLEIRILAKKLGEAKYTESDVQLLCKKLEERQLKLNETLVEVQKLNESIKRVEKKSLKIKESIKEEHNKEITLLTESIKKKSDKQLVEKYIGLKLSHTGLKVHRNSRALLEKCNSADDVDEVFEDIKESMRIAHFAPPTGIDKIKILKERKQNSEETKTTSLVKQAMSGM